VLGYVAPYGTALSATQYYQYGSPFGASFNGPAPPLTSDRSHLFLVQGADGLGLYVVHDKPQDGTGGSTTMHWELAGDTAGVLVFDDPGETVTVSGGGTIFDSAHAWSPCCTDGMVLGALDGQWSIIGAFTNDIASTGMNQWNVYSADNSSIPLVLEKDRRVRLDYHQAIDSEPDGQPHPMALGDDYDGNDDEDGVIFTNGPLVPGREASVDVIASAPGFLNAWLDFNANGSWAELGEHIFKNEPLVAGLNPLTFTVPFSAVPNITTFSRFRFNSTGGLAFDGPADDGEVEDYGVHIRNNPDIKWLQLPDGTSNGIDIRVDSSDGIVRTIADDFLCTDLGLITDVHFWGSWKGDVKGRIKRIHLSIHSDDPPGPGGSDPENNYSKPDKLLWQHDFFAGQFGEALIRDLLDDPQLRGEFWWDPVSGELIPDGDSQIWRIDIDIPPRQAFAQQGSPDRPTIYWLDVQVDTEEGQFGWKTRRWPDHYNDDAVLAVGTELPFIWKELRYPPGHPYHGLEDDSIDMAFVLTTRPRIKWSQPPVPSPHEPRVYIGWDEPSHNLLPVMVADDFFCDSNRPVTAIRWWGSFEGYADDIVPQFDLPDYFYIAIWNNLPADADIQYSRPNDLIWENYCYRYDVSYYGRELDPRGTGINLSKFEFFQKLKPNEYWYQPNDQGIYWLGIMAVYDTHDPKFPWGWETREHFFEDDAVRIKTDPRKYDAPYPPNLIDPITLEGETWDLSFQLVSGGRACWECPFWSLGDADGSGFVNAADVVPIINNLGQPAWVNPCADLDGSGYINAADVVPIINNLGAGDGNICPP